MTADLLESIVAGTRRIIWVREQREPLASLARRAESRAGGGGRFAAAIAREDRLNMIAECKRRSPSRGVLREDYDPVAIARGYESAGAAAISVLTEPTFFDGSLDDLTAVRAAVNVPVLRKDFVVSEYQLFEAVVARADAVLLIVAALTPAELTTLIMRAAALGLDAVVEVHDVDELSVAIDAGSKIVGVNNRNLRTLEVDIHASERLIGRIPKGVVAISESGLRTAEDLVRLRQLGYRAFLMGEQLMTKQDPGGELKLLIEHCSSTRDATRADA